MLKAQYNSSQERCEAYEQTIQEYAYELNCLKKAMRDLRIEFDRQVEVSEAETYKHGSLELFYAGRADAFRLAILALDHRKL